MTPSDQALRLAVGLGDAEREQALLPALSEAGNFVIVERCLAADQMLECIRQDCADVVLLAFDLHRLTSSVLAELKRSRVPLVILVPDPNQEPWVAWPGVVVSLASDPETLQLSLAAAIRGERPKPPRLPDETDTQPILPTEIDGSQRAELSVIALASGHGSPGRTTLAMNLAAALGAVAPTILVDADISGPSIAAHLDANPTRNLYMLAHTEPETPREWDHALEQETQPLASRSPNALVLCGIPKPEMRTRISVSFFDRLVAELRRRYRYVILDVGADLMGPEATVHRAALGMAQHVLLVASADLVGLWHGRSALDLLQNHLSLTSDHLALVINRHDRRYHHSRTEIEWALGVPTAAVIPYDYRPVQQSLAAQRPLIFHGKSRAGRAILGLADRVHGGHILLPSDPVRRAWLRLPDWIPARRPRATWTVSHMTSNQGGHHGDNSVLVGTRGKPIEQRTNGRAHVARGGSNGGEPPSG